MAVDFPKFFATAVELYSLWPSLFNWLAGLIIPLIAALVTATWWMRGYKADAAEAGLKGQIDVLMQRLALATEQQKAASEEAKIFERELAELKNNLPKETPQLQFFTTNLDVTLGRLLTANNAVSSTLTLSDIGGRVPDKLKEEK